MSRFFSCGECGAELTVEEGQLTTTCPYCASPSVLESPPRPDVPTPDFVLGFAIGPDSAKRLAKRWLEGRSWFAVSGIRSATLESVRGVYLPAYLYTGTVESLYSAKIGENYTETKTYWTKDSQGKRVQRTRIEHKTEWHHLEGKRADYVSDIVVTASRGIPNEDLQNIEPFDLRLLCRYSIGMISGWLAEQPTLSASHCLELARSEAVGTIRGHLNKFMPGDHHNSLSFESYFSNESLILVLVPIWSLALRYRPEKPPFRLLINGQSGKAWGKAPLSVVKIVLAILIPLAVLALVLLFSTV